MFHNYIIYNSTTNYSELQIKLKLEIEGGGGRGRGRGGVSVGYCLVSNLLSHSFGYSSRQKIICFLFQFWHTFLYL